jgi:hypothetical protein
MLGMMVLMVRMVGMVEMVKVDIVEDEATVRERSG